MKKLNQLKTFEDACKVEGLNPEVVIGAFQGLSGSDRDPIIAFAKLLIIVRVANRLCNNGASWTPDWSNYKEYKYYPWFEMRGSSGFRFHDYDGWHSRSHVGSRLCFISREAAEYIGQQFQDLYKQFMVIE